MFSSHVASLAAAAAFVLTAALEAQKTTPLKTGSGGSPHVRSEWAVDGANIAIEYGRPSMKGRPEAQMMPHGQVWRMGADEQTTLKVDRPITIGALVVPAGTYGLHALPNANEWHLIVSKRQSGWGIPYPDGQDLGRIPMKVGKTGAPVEQLTIHVDDTQSGGLLRVEWGTVSASVPFTVG